MLKNFLLVGAGGAVGSMLRYAIALMLPRAENGFPWATLLVNLAGCLLIGVLAGFGTRGGWLNQGGWLLLATGLCGGFTTFSAFALEHVKLFEAGSPMTAIIYAVLSLALGIMLCYLGYIGTATVQAP